jgi:hypothetical protein
VAVPWFGEPVPEGDALAFGQVGDSLGENSSQLVRFELRAGVVRGWWQRPVEGLVVDRHRPPSPQLVHGDVAGHPPEPRCGHHRPRLVLADRQAEEHLLDEVVLVAVPAEDPTQRLAHERLMLTDERLERPVVSRSRSRE